MKAQMVPVLLLTLGLLALSVMDAATWNTVGRVTNGFFSLEAAKAYHIGYYLVILALVGLALLAVWRE